MALAEWQVIQPLGTDSEPATFMDGSPRPSHVTSSRDVSRFYLEQRIFPVIPQMAEIYRQGGTDLLPNSRARLLTEGESTRTVGSMKSACELLGFKEVFVTENALQITSLAKGEPRTDMREMIEQQGYHLLGWRTEEQEHEDSIADVASPDAKLVVINMGNKSTSRMAPEHPSQLVGDLITMQQRRALMGRSLDNMEIVMATHPDTRVSRSMWRWFADNTDGTVIHFVGHPDLQPKKDELDYLNDRNVVYTQSRSLAETLKNSDPDVLIMMRWQSNFDTKFKGLPLEQKIALAEEKFGLADTYLTPDVLRFLPKYTMVLHPLPRGKELPNSVRGDSRILAFGEQVRNGLYGRMGVIADKLAPQDVSRMVLSSNGSNGYH